MNAIENLNLVNLLMYVSCIYKCLIFYCFNLLWCWWIFLVQIFQYITLLLIPMTGWRTMEILHSNAMWLVSVYFYFSISWNPLLQVRSKLTFFGTSRILSRLSCWCLGASSSSPCWWLNSAFQLPFLCWAAKGTVLS